MSNINPEYHARLINYYNSMHDLEISESELSSEQRDMLTFATETYNNYVTYIKGKLGFGDDVVIDPISGEVSG